MHDSAHWSAIDPLDLSPDEWLTDPEKYRSWSCTLGLALGAVPLADKDTEEPLTPMRVAAAAEALRREVAELGSVAACEGLGVTFNARRW